MFGRVNNEKNQQSAAKDENVRKESQREEDLKFIQPIGNEAAAGMPPQLPPNIGNETVNGILNDHYAENMLQFPKLSKGRQMDESIEQALDLQTRIAKKPKKKQKPSGRNAGKRSAPFKANTPIQDLASPGQKLGSAGNLNVEDLLRKQQEEKDKFRIIERPHDNNNIIENMDDDEGGRFIKTKDEENNRSGTSIRNGGLKLLSVAEEDQKRPVKKSQSGGMRERYDDEDENEIISEYFDDDKKKTGRKSIQKADLNISADDLFASYIEEEDRFREEDEEKEEEPVQEKKNKEDNSEYDDYALEEDMRPSASAKNNEKDRRNKTKKKKGVKARELGKDEINNLQEVDQNYWKGPAMERLKKIQAEDKFAEQNKDLYAQEMEKLKNWDFHAEKLDEVQSPSKLRRFLTWAAIGAGKLFGGMVSLLTQSGFWRARSSIRAGRKRKDSWQQETDHQIIPGWDGEKYDPNATKGEDVMADFRRVPTVWSHLIAAKASEKTIKNGKEVEKPLDPVVSILVDQPKSGTSQTMNKSDMGHVMLGVEYSRRSMVTNRYERYKLQYGFYPQSSALMPSTTSVMMKDNAVIPGELVDDYSHGYDVSRSYPAKPSQVNAIFQASEKYADGGYGFYDRNCATFVKEMIVNKARLATGGDIFKRTDVQFSHLANAVMMGSSAFNENTRAGADNLLMDLSEQDAESYLKYGNKKATYRDWENYKGSMREGSSWTKQTYVPADIAEHMRRMEGKGTGEIGSRKYSEGLKDNEGNLAVGLTRLSSAIEKQVNLIEKNWEDIISEEQMQQAPLELTQIISDIDSAYLPIDSISSSIENNMNKYNEGKEEKDQLNRGTIKEKDFITPDELRNARQELSDSVSRINLFLNNYMKNDRRFHNDLMNLLSLLQYAITYIDELYAETVRGGKSDGENPDNIREEMIQKKYTVKAGGQEAEFTPTHYESYIQIYKDPEIAVAKYNRLQELRKKKKEHGAWTNGKRLSLELHRVKSALHPKNNDEMSEAEFEELKKLDRMDKLADQFDSSHNYMLEKEQYSQQDIDYAFRLNYREKFGERKKKQNGLEIQDDVDFRDDYKSASGIYISLFLDKIFHGLKEAWMKAPVDDSISTADRKKNNAASEWIDNFFVDRVKSKKNEFQMIIRGLTRAMKTEDPEGKVSYDKLKSKISEILIKILVDRNFKTDDLDDKALFGNMQFHNYILTVWDDKSFKFSGMLNSMIAVCMKETRDMPKDRMYAD